MTHIIRKTILRCVAATLALTPFPLLAEDGVLDEILVTASKREQSVQDVSVAVTALSGADLAALGVGDSFRLDVFVPGLQLGQSGSGNTT